MKLNEAVNGILVVFNTDDILVFDAIFVIKVQMIFWPRANGRRICLDD